MRVVSMTGLIISVFLASACSTPTVAQSSPAANVTLFEGARLITGDGSLPVENAAFVVNGDRIVQVGRKGQLELLPGAARVDLTGKTVMPAIIDTVTPLPRERQEVVEQLERHAYYGVGVVTGLGYDAGDAVFQVRQATIPNTARVLTAGRGITGPEPGRTDQPYWITTETEGRAAVVEQAARKVDLIKIWVDDRGVGYRKLTPQAYGAIIDEAHKHGLRVISNIFELEDAKGLLRAGLDGFAHGIRDFEIDEEFLALFKQHPDSVLVPRFLRRGVARDVTWLSDSVGPGQLAKLGRAVPNPIGGSNGVRLTPDQEAVFAIESRNLAKLNAAGVRIAFGTDTTSGWWTHFEMEDMVKSGMTPAQVIVAATRTSAEFLRLTDLGTIATGKSANFLVLDANPLDDITNTRRISAVYLRGTAVDRAALRSRWTRAGSN